MLRRDRNKIVVFGALNMDLIVETPRPAGPGETAEGTRFYTAPGGKGGNQAVAASRLADGVDRVLMVGRIGDDVFGAELRSYLEKQRVNTKYVQTDIGQSSGVAVIFVEPGGENYVNPVYGANARCDDWQYGDAKEAMKRAAVLLVQQETPLTPHAGCDGGRPGDGRHGDPRSGAGAGPAGRVPSEMQTFSPRISWKPKRWRAFR